MSEVATTAASASTQRMPGILGGAMIVAGTSIGAGMFALPVYSAGMWFGWSLVLMAICCFCAYSSGMYLAEATLNYKDGANYSSIARDTLGKVGQVIGTGCVAFVCFIITYAYVSGGSSVVTEAAKGFGFSLSQPISAVVFGTVLAAIVLAGTRAVDRVSTVMLGGMVLTFFGSTGMMASGAQPALLFPEISMAETAPFLFVAIPVLVTSFGFHGCVPSLVKHYRRDPKRVRLALLTGSGLTMLVYVFWELVIMGNVPREQFPQIIAEGGNVATLIAAVGQHTSVSGVESALVIFGNLALASSFLGVSLGLVDLVKDTLKLDDSVKGTAIAGAVAFIPPILGGALAPNGFILAIGYAALAASVFVLVLPALMARVLRQRGQSQDYQVKGGLLRLDLVLAFGVFAVMVEIANMMGMLPQFG